MFEEKLKYLHKGGGCCKNKFGQLIDASFRPFFQLDTSFSEFENNWLPTDRRRDRRTDGPTDERTDGRTYPLIEMRERIENDKGKKRE